MSKQVLLPVGDAHPNLNCQLVPGLDGFGVTSIIIKSLTFLVNPVNVVIFLKVLVESYNFGQVVGEKSVEPVISPSVNCSNTNGCGYALPEYVNFKVSNILNA